MKKNVLLFLLLFLSVACGDKRPDGAENFTFSVMVFSPLEGGIATLFEGENEVGRAFIADGVASFDEISASNRLRATVCQGRFKLSSHPDGVVFGGCLRADIPLSAEQQSYEVVVNMISTLIASYAVDSAQQEWLDYLKMEREAFSKQEISLTDATKGYLWQQALSLVAKKISDAKGITPETSLSTEKLLGLLIDDLEDNHLIDGSTKIMFGEYPVDASLLRKHIPLMLSSVSDSFTDNDLQEWKEALEEGEAPFLGDNISTNERGPQITFSSPEADVVSRTIKVIANAEDDDGVEYLRCKIEDEIEDESSDKTLFVGSLDTSQFADGNLVISCIASDGVHISTAEKVVVISNKNSVEFFVYTTALVEDVDAITAYDLEGIEIKTVKKGADGVFRDVMPAGISVFKTEGGSYFSNITVAPHDEVGDNPQTKFSLNTSLLSRSEIRSGVLNRVYINPITTIRENIYSSLQNSGESSAVATEHSLAYLQQHYGTHFDPYLVPLFSTPGSSDTTTFLAIAALEYQANSIALSQHIDAGTISLSDMLQALHFDLQDDALFDGKDGSGFSIYLAGDYEFDSYFFRMYDALALKNYIENSTQFDVKNFDYLINSISLDDSPLFPLAALPKSVGDAGIVIKNTQFRRAIDVEWNEYSIDNKIYSTDKIFEIRFSVDVPDDLIVAEISIESDEVKVVGLIEHSGENYQLKLQYAEIMVDGEEQQDGEKSLVIRMVDSGGTVTLVPVVTIRDTLFPSLVLSETPEGAYVSLPFQIAYKADDANMMLVESAAQKSGDSAVFSPRILFEGTKQFSDSETSGDGGYTFLMRATDRAGNSVTESFDISVDAASPLVSTVETRPEMHGDFLWSRDIEIVLTAHDEITADENLSYFYTLDGAETVESESSTIYLTSLASGKHTLLLSVVDEAGNTTEFIRTFEVDASPPDIVVSNRGVLEGGAFKLDDEKLNLVYLITENESGIEVCSFSVNGAFPETLSEKETHYSFANHIALLEGNNEVVVTCYDKSGQQKSVIISPIVIDNHPPSFIIEVNNDAGLTSFRSRVNSHSVEATIKTSEENYTVFWKLSCPSRSFKMESDATIFRTDVLPDDTPALNGYRCFIEAVVSDAAGNIGVAPLVEWIVDMTAPQITWNAKNIYMTTDILLDLDFDEKAYLGDFYVDGERKPYTMWSHWCSDVHLLSAHQCRVEGLSEGEHTFKLLLQDSRGVTGDASDCSENNYGCLEKTVFIDTSKPNLTVVVDEVMNSSVSFTALSSSNEPIPTVVSCDIAQAQVWPLIGFNHLVDCDELFGAQVVDLDGVGDSSQKYVIRFSIERNGKSVTAFKSFVLDLVAPVITSMKILNPQEYYFLGDAMKVRFFLGAKESRITGEVKLKDRRRLESFTQDVDDGIPITQYSFGNEGGLIEAYGIDKTNVSSFDVTLFSAYQNSTAQVVSLSIRDDAGNHAEKSFSIQYNHTRHEMTGTVLPYEKEVVGVKWLALMPTKSFLYDFSDGPPFFENAIGDESISFYEVKDSVERKLSFVIHTLRYVCTENRDDATLLRAPHCFANEHAVDGFFKIYCEPAIVRCKYLESGSWGNENVSYVNQYSWPEGVNLNAIKVTYKVTDEYGGYKAVFNANN
ncbi:hypothetical protein KAH37_07900 [bacterium]|nr:hypothetical protein [bacterium]